ncbi:zinc finger protein 292b [Colossoma macropomum]|uniref:zinc finger protein 292b n=1 Tax=Colossoma macropomum TaxID=42526 RepID=UPI0018653A8D|nr:zinc finger protein 292b [Colossoma macropomum]
MADGQEELERAEDSGTGLGDRHGALMELSVRLQRLEVPLRERERRAEESAEYCRAFCTTLLEYVGQWRCDDDPAPVLEGYTVALLSFARASTHLSPQCENVPDLLEKLSLSCVELLLSISNTFPEALWEQFQSSVEMAHSLLQQNGIPQLRLLFAVTRERGLWANSTLQSILNNETPQEEKIYEFFTREGPELLHMRVKYLIKENFMDRAALLAKACADFPEFDRRRVQFKQIYLVCLCTVAPQQTLMEELSKVDCRDALEMICNLEAEGDEKGAFTLCSGFLSRQLLQEDTYCAWELTLFWSKLLKRLEPSEQGFLERCRQMSRLAKTVFHLLFFIRVIQSESDKTGLPTCIEMCIRALRMESCEGANKATICKTISCLLPADLEVKRACQLTEFLLEPTVDSYYAVETLYNEPDQKLEEESLPIPNSLRCELLLVFKTQWPFDPEFWDWKTLKRHCLGLMGEEASIVSSIDELNDDHPEEQDDLGLPPEFKDVSEYFLDATNELKEIADQRQKNREMKKLREKGFVSARFRNWQAYMQYCVLCDKEFLGHRIVRHAQTHFKDGYYSCPICVETFETRETLDPHVASHVKMSCKERLAAMKTTKKLASEKAAAPAISTLKAKTGENQARKTKAKNNCNGDFDSLYNGDAVGPQTAVAGIKADGKEGNICPVPHCRKGFKYFRNLIAHVKDHGEVEEAKRFLEMQNSKIVCQYCRRQFVNVSHLNDHLQVHCGTKPYICIQLNCKASFDSNAELLMHRKEHPVFKAKCMFPGCGKIFSEAYKLYDHEAQHYKTFTCKVPGCGKVFHAQSQLDLHEESHNAKKVEAENPESQSAHPVEPLPEQSSQPIKEAVQQDILPGPPLHSSCPLSPSNHPLSLVKVKHSIESMLSSASPGSTQAFDPGTHKAEPPDPDLIQQQISHMDNQVIQPPVNPMPPLNEPRPEDSLLDVLMNDPILAAPCPVPPTSTYQNILEDYQPAPSRDVLQGQMQGTVSQSHNLPLYNNSHSEYGQYSPNPIAQVQAQYQAPYGNNMTSLTQPVHNNTTVMPVSQRLPPQVTPFPTNMQVSESRPAQPLHTNSLGPAAEEKEKFKCAYENCSREYCSYRSLTKHMKATHPEFYTQWKLARKNSKMHQTASTAVSMNGNPNSVASLQNQRGQRIPAPTTQMQNAAGRSAYPASCASSSYPSVSSHLPAPTGQPFPNQMESILDPIVLSQLGSTSNQSHIALDPSWNSLSVNSSLQQRACQSQAVTSNVDVLSSNHFSSLMNTVSQGQGTDVQHQGMVYPSLQPQSNSPCNFISSQTDGTQKINSPTVTGHTINSSASSYTQQPKSNSVPFSKHTECVVKLERNPSLGLPVPNSSQQNTSSTVENFQDDGGSSTSDSDIKRAKRSRRTKWPAIIRDGKFICCRCFREFQSPKSLGGHLSKRAHCKAFDEADLTADLPASFLELLNSPVNAPQPTSSVHENSNQPLHIVNKGPLDPKLFPNVTFLHGKDSPYTSNTKPNTEIIKQKSANLCESVGGEQQTFTSTSASYPQDGQSSVIQHTGNIKENNQHQISYTQPCSSLYTDSDLSDPLLSRLLGEDNSSASVNRVPTDHIDKILQTETLNKIKEIKDKSTIVNSSGLSNDGLLAAMASLAQNLVSEKSVKEKLREQILAGDFHKKNSLCQGDANLQNSLPSSPTRGVPQQASLVIQRIPQSDHHFGNDAKLSSEHAFKAASVALNDGSAQISVASVSTGSDINDESTNLPVLQEDEVTEIQRALERLDLDREVSEHDQATVDPSKNDGLAKTSNVMNSTVEMPGFSCDSDSCGYRAMTKDALFKHLIKLHNYTDDMLNRYRKDQVKLAPFTCQVCSKNFTRNSNLKVHYQTVHNYTHEQIAKLRIKHQYNRRSVDCDGSPCPTPNISDLRNQSDSPVQKTICDGGQQQHIDVAGLKGLVATDARMKSECSVQPFAQQPHVGPLDTSHQGTVQTALATPSESQAANHQSVIRSGPSLVAPSSVAQQLNGHLASRPFAPSQHIPGMPPGGLLPGGLLPTSAPLVPLTPAVSASTSNLSLDKKPKLGRPKLPKPREVSKKPKKTDTDDVFSPYRPYRCVHQGCVAAFTIQQNLILHYKAIHQSDLPKFEDNNNEGPEEEEEHEDADEHDIPDNDVTEAKEFRCQVKDCSRIFLVVTDLLQHYLQLHRLSLDKAGAMMSGLNLGKFQCDQPNCAATFTAFWKYVSHIDKEHKPVKVSKADPVEGMYRCEVEGCECYYSTRSNLLRHTMKKHQDVYKLQLMKSKGVKLGRPRKNPYACLEKENREINKKPEKKAGEKKRRAERNNHWTKYGKPILKTKEEASAICTKRFPLQYPCMIKGCETVASSERHIIKHYVQHGLPKQYLEEQRSNYIHCKKLPRSRYKRITSRSDDTDKSDESSVEMSENERAADTAPSESEFSKPASEKETTEDAKPSTDTSSDISVVVKRRRGRPRKAACNRNKLLTHKRVTRLRTAHSYTVNYADVNSDSTSSSITLPQEEVPEQKSTLSSFKPMGFEVSFLQFLEQSSQSAEKRKATVVLDAIPRKKTTTVKLKTASVVCSRSDVLKLVEFKNPQKLTSLKNVTFEVHRGFSNVFELLLKQLHEMRPAVVIQKEGLSDSI